MSVLGNLKVWSKIIAGYLIVLGLMLAIGVVAIYRLDQIDTTVTQFADELAEEQNMTSEIVPQNWTIRYYAQRYIDREQSQDLSRFNTELANHDTLLNEAKNLITSDEREQLLADIEADVDVYSSTFFEIVNLIDERNTIAQGTLDVQGELVLLRLQALRDEIVQTGNPQTASIAFYAGNAQQSFMQIRQNTFRYLATGDPQWVSTYYLQDTVDALQTLKQQLDDPEQLDQVAEIEGAVDTYVAALALLEANFEQQTELISEGLDVAGSQLEVSTATMLASVSDEFDATQEDTSSLVDQTRLIMFVVMIIAGVFGLGTGLVISYTITNPITALIRVIRHVAAGDLEQRAPVTTRDEIGELSQAFNRMTETIQTQTRDLQEGLLKTQEQSQALQTSAEISRQVATILDPDQLLPHVVEQAKDNFRLYHAHIYLLDEDRENLVLAAGAGEAGRIMKQRGHSIPIDADHSIVAHAARSNEPIITDDVTDSPDFLANPLLPDTRSEAAFPLVVGDRVLGVLDVQSEQTARFDADFLVVLSTLAGQIAVALDNARLFSEVDRASRHEQALSAVTHAIQGATSIEEVLQAAARELGRALRVPHTAIEMQLQEAVEETEPPDASPDPDRETELADAATD